MSPRVPRDHVPHAPQQAFLLLDDLEAFYGGAAGGGKSDALLMAALQYDDFPQYRALILRRTYPELSMPGAIMDRAKSWLMAADGVTWSASDHVFTFPSGASLTFAHAQYEDDVMRFASTEFHFIGIDELTRFSERMYRFLFSRIRKNKDDPLPLRMRGASNPGDIGHQWVKDRFVTPGNPERPFIPARLSDNPSLNQEQYVRNLMQLHPLERQRLLEGDWDVAAAGEFFRRDWWQMAPEPPKEFVRVVRYWDLAATPPDGSNDPDYTAGAKLGLDKAGRVWVLDIRRTRATSHDVESLVAQTAALDGKSVMVRIEQEPGASGKSLVNYYQRTVLAGYATSPVVASGAKTVRAAPLASQAQAGNVTLIAGPWVSDFLDEADIFPGGAHDDQIDAVAGAYEALMKPAVAHQTAYVTPYRQPVIKKGGLVLVGERYVDKQAGSTSRG